MSDTFPVPVADRLRKGAQIIGKLWKDNVRCPEGFSVLCESEDPTKAIDCFCEEKTPFCRAKKQWLDLAAKDKREIVQGEMGLMETMSGSEWDATGITVKMEFPGIGVHGIGPNGVMRRSDLIKLGEAPETLGAIMNMMKTFPGMKVEEILPPAPVEVPKVKEEDFWG